MFVHHNDSGLGFMSRPSSSSVMSFTMHTNFSVVAEYGSQKVSAHIIPFNKYSSSYFPPKASPQPSLSTTLEPKPHLAAYILDSETWSHNSRSKRIPSRPSSLPTSPPPNARERLSQMGPVRANLIAELLSWETAGRLRARLRDRPQRGGHLVSVQGSMSASLC